MVSFSHNIARLQPQDTPCQKLREFSIEIKPLPFESNEFLDAYTNVNKHILIREPHKELEVIGNSHVEIFPQLIEQNIKHLKQNSTTYTKALERLASFHVDDVAAKEFLYESELISKASAEIKSYVLDSFQPERDLYEAAEEFMGRIFHDFDFVSGFSDITTPIEEIFKAKKGVCQDFAQFAIAALRSIGLPAKYMSGYIETLPPEGEEKLFGVDASHALFALYIPGAGWAEFDPTNNMVPLDQHIRLGSGRDYYDVSPLKGVVVSSGSSQLSVMVDVRRQEESKTFSIQKQQQDSNSQQQQNQF